MKKRAALVLALIIVAALVIGIVSPAYSFFNLFGGGAPKPKGKVSGMVIGPSNINMEGSRYMPVEGANVTLKGEKCTLTTQTDKTGAFYFGDVPPGEYNLSIQKPGFGPFLRKVHLNEGETLRVDNIGLVPGGDFTSPTGIIEPDTVYVAYAETEKPKYASETSMWRRAAVAAGANPFEVSGMPSPDYTNINPYEPGMDTSSNPNTLMTMDPMDSSKVNYVKLEARPTWLTFNAAGTKLYVATDQNFVQVYDILHNNILIGGIQLPAPATDLCLSKDGAWLFVSYGGIGGVMVCSARDQTPANNIEMPAMSNGETGIPMGIVASRDNLRLFATLSSMTFGEVVAVDAYTKQPVARAPVGQQPVGMAMSPDGSKIYVCNHNSASVSVLSTNPLALINTVPVGVSPARCCVSPDGGKVYVTNKGSNTVSVLSGATGSLQGHINVGKEPMGLAITGDGSRLYVANFADATVSVIDTRANYVIKTTKAQPMSKPFGVAVKP